MKETKRGSHNELMRTSDLKNNRGLKMKIMKNPIPTPLKYAFAFLAVGFTFISAYNGFNFYRIIFNLFTAILISTVFEIARLSSLFSLFRLKEKKKILSTVIYVIVASVCAFASINYFTSRVIEQNLAEEKEYEIRIHMIKKAYSERMEEKLETLNRDINYLENMIAKYPDRDYWKRRLLQIQINRDNLIAERDKFLGENPENPGEWIQKNSAKLGLDLKELPKESEKITSVNQALRELWGLKKVTAQKIIGIILTFTIELLIILLAFLSSGRIGSDRFERITDEKTLMEILGSHFDEKAVRKFLSVSRDYFRKKRKLPPLRRLNPNLRPIRKAMEGFDQESLKKIFGK
jgi:hypothetical protein